MKKLFFTLTLMCVLFSTGNAQTTGKFWLGGNIGFSSTIVEDDVRNTSYSILPEFGYIFSERWALGVNVGYSYSKTTNYIDIPTLGSDFIYTYTRYNLVNSTDNFSIVPFVRYSFLKGSIGNLFVDGSIGYTYGKQIVEKTDYTIGKETETHTVETGFRPGVAINLSNHVAITGKFGFFGYQRSKEEEQNTDYFGFSINMRQFQVGVNIVL
ncbi:MAG: porin family protein [Tannerella sp.]|jgi:hypothetical protein|nr:porin family protein [Tannerella sp.]